MDHERCLELCKQILSEGIFTDQNVNQIDDNDIINLNNITSVYKKLCGDVFSSGMNAGRITVMLMYANKMTKKLCMNDELLSILAEQLIVSGCKASTLLYIIDCNRYERQRLHKLHYQELLDGLADDFTLADVESMKYLFKDYFSSERVINTSIQLLTAFNDVGLISATDISKLEFACKLLPRRDLLPKIRAYKETN